MQPASVIRPEVKVINPSAPTCRFCLTNNSLIHIFPQQINNVTIVATATESILSKLVQNQYMPVAENDDFPNFICTDCLNVITEWHEFREKCLNTYEIWQSITSRLATMSTGAREGCEYAVTLMQDIPVTTESQGQISVASTGNDDTDLKLEDEDVSNEEETNECSETDRVLTVMGPMKGKPRTKGYRRRVNGSTAAQAYECDRCEKTYRNRTLLRLHFEREHLLLRYPCTECGKIFATKDTRAAHLILHRSVVYPCDQCEQSFTSNKYLYKHKQKHLGLKKYVCSVCSKAFRIGQYLKDHMLSHTGERPFECETCGKCFRMRNHLNQHHRVHAKADKTTQ